MNTKAILIFVIAIALAGCVLAVSTMLMDNGAEDDDGRTVTDIRGRSVTIDGDIDSIVCLHSNSTELLSYFESFDKVVAIDAKDLVLANKTYTQVQKDKMESVKKISATNTEEIIRMAPSVIISADSDVSAIDSMSEVTNVPAYAIDADIEFGDEKWFDQIILLGELLGEQDRAKEIVDGVRSVISAITAEKVEDVTGYTCGMMFYGSGSFLKTSGDWLAFDFSGVRNVMPSSSSGVGKQPYNIGLEDVLAKDFDYAFIDGSSYGNVANEAKGYKDEGLYEKTAFTNGDVYKVLTYKIWGTQYDAALINCLYVAKTVNGDAYAWGFEEMADKVLEIFYGKGAITYSDVADLQNGGCRQAAEAF